MKRIHIFLTLCILGLLWGCSSSTPELRSSETLTITVSPDEIKNLGETALIRIRATNADGNPAFDGTRIFLDLTGGGSVPAEVLLEDGEATAVYTSGTRTGTITVTASSGALSASDTLDVVDGFVAASTVNVSVNPNNLSAIGGDATIRVSVRDSTGFPIPNRDVLFSSDRGVLASNGAPKRTNSDGLVSDVLSLNPLDLTPSVNTINLSILVDATTYTTTVTITDNASPVPVINISPEVIVEGDTANFSATGSTDSDGEIVDYAWQFGDGGTGVGETVEHVYDAAGTYVVILTATDNEGAQTSTSTTLTIDSATANVAPVPAFSWSPTSVRAEEPVQFDASDSTDSDGSISIYEWNFGDGSTERTGRTVTHIFPGADTYEVTLRLTDNEGETAVLKQEVTVAGNTLPTAEFTPSPTTLLPGESVLFDASASADSDGEIVSYFWEFGDGSELETQQTQIDHTYTQEGSFIIFLTVTDNDGGLGYATGTVTVTSNSGPTAAFTFTPSAPNTGDPVIFDGSSSTDDIGVETYLWNFGNGRQGIGKLVTHVFRDAGTFPVRLTVFDAEGASDQTIQNVTVALGTAPVPALTISTLDDVTIVLDASGTTDDEDDITDLNFRFDSFVPDGVALSVDGGTGPVREAVVETTATAFTAFFLLTVTDTDGNQAQLTGSYTYSITAKR